MLQSFKRHITKQCWILLLSFVVPSVQCLILMFSKPSKLSICPLTFNCFLHVRPRPENSIDRTVLFTVDLDLEILKSNLQLLNLSHMYNNLHPANGFSTFIFSNFDIYSLWPNCQSQKVNHNKSEWLVLLGLQMLEFLQVLGLKCLQSRNSYPKAS